MEEQKQIFITGASGFIGQQLALKLAKDGNKIHALVRNIEKATPILVHPNIVLFHGDILNSAQVKSAMQHCTEIYHLAALASVWNRDKTAFYKVNVLGLKTVLDCALNLGINHFLFTSTAGLVGDSKDGKPVNETSNFQLNPETLYEQSKLDAEKLLTSYVTGQFKPVMVNPSRVYGPGIITESNGFTKLLKMYTNGKWKIKPADGEQIGNYVFIDDVIDGIISAMECGKPGERYLLGGIDATYNEFFAVADELTNTQRKLYNVPLPVLLVLSHLQVIMAKIFNRKPLISPSFVRKYNKNWMVDSSKAKTQLNYKITPLKEGIEKTLKWLKTNN